MTTKEICRRFGMSRSTLIRFRAKGLPYSRPVLGGIYDYDPVVVEVWLQESFAPSGKISGQNIIAARRARGIGEGKHHE